MKHRPRIRSPHSHQGTSGTVWPADDCPHCREEFLHENADGLLKAAISLIALMDEVESDDDEADRVFANYEFEELRAAVRAAEGQA